MDCREFEKHMGEYVDRTLDESVRKSAEEHLRECGECACLVNELEGASLLVKSLERTQAPFGFEQRLRERLAAQNSRSAGVWQRFLEGFLRPAFKPAIVGMLVLAVVAVSFFMVGNKSDESVNSMDWAYIDTLSDQHASFAGASPLADQSAVDLRARASELGSGL